MSTPRRLSGTLLVAALLLLAANAVVHRLAANVPARALLRKLAAAPPADVIALGNSTMAAGFDETAFSHGWAAEKGEKIRPLNAALGATDSVPHLLLLRAALNRQPDSHALIYGFFDFMLTDPAPDWRSIMGNNAMVFYTEPEVAAQYLTSNAGERMAFRLLGEVPMFVERGNTWAYVERLRRSLGGLGLPAAAVNRFGRVADFDQLLVQDSVSFRHQATELVARGAALSAPVDTLLRFARGRGLETYVVAMPLPGVHRSYYQTPEWAAYLGLIRHQLDALGCRLLVANAWVPDDGKFADALHLSPAGAVEFSEQLGRELARQTGPTARPK